MDFRAFSCAEKEPPAPSPDAIFDATSIESNNFRHRCHALALNIRIAVHIFLHRTLSHDTLKKYFPRSYTAKQMEKVIIKLLDNWLKKRQQEQQR